MAFYNIRTNNILRKTMHAFYGPFLNEISSKADFLKSYHMYQAVSRKKVHSSSQPIKFPHTHLLKMGEVTPKLDIQTYRTRRFKLMDSISTKSRAIHKDENHIIVIPSATKVFMSENIPYPFRQNTDFLYLTGLKEPDSVLIMHSLPNRPLPEHHSVLFLQESNEHSERWEGRRTNINHAITGFGVDSACYIDDLESYLHSQILQNSNLLFWFDYSSFLSSRTYEIVKGVMSSCKNINFLSPRSSIHKLRLLKSAEEITLMEKSCEIAAESMKEVMKFAYSGICESHLHAKMDFECRIRGADYLAFPPVVAGGARANTIHYISNNHIVEKGETVLMDAGCEFQGYSSDMTRTWPVSGHFSKPQRELYEVILSVQEELIDLCYTFPSLDYLFQKMCEIMGLKLQNLGIISSAANKEEASKEAYNFCPHHVSHYLGMDVHDTNIISRNIKIHPGMVITIEPGIYVQSDDYRVPEQYRGLCVRIEDDVLITEEGPKILTLGCPRNISDIENVLRK